MKTKQNYFFILLTFLALSLFVFPFPMNAKDKVDIHQITETEKVIFAYHKLAREPLNFESMVERRKDYRETESATIKQRIYEDNIIRLKLGYARFKPEKDYISIKTDINLLLTKDEEGQYTLSFNFVGAQDSEVPYFPFEWGEEFITIIIKDLKRFTSLDLKEDSAKRIKKYFRDDTLYEAKLNIELKPISAKTKDGIIIDGTKHWPMLADVARFEYMYKPPQNEETISLLGAYNAPWYIEGKKTEQLETEQKIPEHSY